MSETDGSSELSSIDGQWFTLTRSAAVNLDTFARLLIEEALERKYTMDTRDKFVLAVGASALILERKGNVPYVHVAELALLKHGPLALIDAEDADMPHWDNSEWRCNIQRIAADVWFTDPLVDGDMEHTTGSYVAALDALQHNKAYFMSQRLSTTNA